jgi:hypothetical protein
VAERERESSRELASGQAMDADRFCAGPGVRRWAVDQDVAVAETVTDLPDFLIVREVLRARGRAQPRYTL